MRERSAKGADVQGRKRYKAEVLVIIVARLDFVGAKKVVMRPIGVWFSIQCAKVLLFFEIGK